MEDDKEELADEGNNSRADQEDIAEKEELPDEESHVSEQW
jgi:hypothetical protein